MNPWLLLACAIAFEVCGTFLLKLSDGFVKWHFGVLSIISFLACFAVLGPAMKVLPVGLVYAVWAGIGIVAATLIGTVIFEERLSLIQLGCIFLILLGSIGLKLTSPD